MKKIIFFGIGGMTLFLAIAKPSNAFALVSPVTCGASWTRVLNQAQSLASQYTSLATQLNDATLISDAAYYQSNFETYNHLAHVAPDSDACYKIFAIILEYNSQMSAGVTSLTSLLNAKNNPVPTATPSPSPSEEIPDAEPTPVSSFVPLPSVVPSEEESGIRWLRIIVK